MADDSYTTITSESWGSRLSQSLSGILIGLVLFIAAFPLLFWNEGRAVDRAQALETGATAVISVASDQVNPANEGKLVHTIGLADTKEILTDPDFGISETAIKLKRKVQMYQWIEDKHTETKEKLGGSKETVTTYTYKKGWSDTLHDSSAFQKPEAHRNPDSMAFASREYKASVVHLGAFRLNDEQINGLNRTTPLSLTGRTLPTKLAGKPATRQGDVLFLGSNQSVPQVGDMRVSFEAVKPARISVVAQQNGDSFVPYVTKTGSVSLLEYGDQSAAAMFKNARESNAMWTWILRGVGFLVMFIGLKLVLAPLRILAAVVPFVATLVGFGTGLVAFLLAISLSLITIAVAWLAVRPLLGGLLLAGGIGVPLLLKLLKKNKASAIGPAS